MEGTCLPHIKAFVASVPRAVIPLHERSFICGRLYVDVGNVARDCAAEDPGTYIERARERVQQLVDCLAPKDSTFVAVDGAGNLARVVHRRRDLYAAAWRERHGLATTGSWHRCIGTPGSASSDAVDALISQERWGRASTSREPGDAVEKMFADMSSSPTSEACVVYAGRLHHDQLLFAISQEACPNVWLLFPNDGDGVPLLLDAGAVRAAVTSDFRSASNFVVACSLLGTDFLPPIVGAASDCALGAIRDALADVPDIVRESTLDVRALGDLLEVLTRRDPMDQQTLSSCGAAAMCHSYVQGLAFAHAYYVLQSPPSRCAYPFLRGPLASDVYRHARADAAAMQQRVILTAKSAPPHATGRLVHLLAVLPPQLSAWVPHDALRSVMTDLRFGCVDMYPVEFRVDDRTGAPILPPLDLDRLEAAVTRVTAPGRTR